MATKDPPLGASDTDEAPSNRGTDVVIQAFGLRRYYPILGGPLKRHIGDVKAVDGVDVKIERGRTHGLVGESGCGKSTLARMLVRLDEPTAGHIYFDTPADVAAEIEELEEADEADLSDAERTRLAELREQYEINTMTGERAKEFRRNAQFVFQNPTSSLNPRRTIRNIVGQNLRLRDDVSQENYDEKVGELLEQVGLGEDFLRRHPHMLSGGQKQRVAIARAIAPDPELIVLDEPTSALDVSVQAQILNLLEDLQNELGLTYLFITHDLGVIHHAADDVSVMYLGKRVETAPTETLFETPLHPYSEALLSASPAMPSEEEIEIQGDVPEADDPPTGCYFHTRCHRAEAFCGWSGRDVESLLRNQSEYDETATRLYERLEETDHDGYSSHFTFEDASAGRELAEILEDGGADLRSYNPPLFDAIEDVTAGERDVGVTFTEVPTPVLAENEPDHEVACFLCDPPGKFNRGVR